LTEAAVLTREEGLVRDGTVSVEAAGSSGVMLRRECMVSVMRGEEVVGAATAVVVARSMAGAAVAVGVAADMAGLGDGAGLGADMARGMTHDCRALSMDGQQQQEVSLNSLHHCA